MHGDGAARTRVVATSAALATVLAATGACGGPAPGRAADRDPSPTGTKGPETTTYTRLKSAPEDIAPAKRTDGTVVHPSTARPVYNGPAGQPIATLPATQLGSPTWVPVVDRSGGWIKVLLPSRPNGATGWLSTAGGALRTARTPFVIKVDIPRRRLTLVKDGDRVGRWTVAVGGPKTPTPRGRTFLLALLKPDRPSPSPLIIPLGAHSATLDTFGGGPGTVALHGWPDASVFGKAVTHGCVRVPRGALRALSRVPLGTLVHIS